VRGGEGSSSLLSQLSQLAKQAPSALQLSPASAAYADDIPVKISQGIKRPPDCNHEGNTGIKEPGGMIRQAGGRARI